MRNVKVTAVLAAPLAGHAPMLDALCESVMQPKMSSVLNTRGGQRHRREGRDLIPIPILRRRCGEHLVPCASSPIIEPASEFVEHFAKRLAIAEPEVLASKSRTQINHTGGEFKGYRLPLRCHMADRIVWFAVAVPKSGKTGGAMSHLRSQLKLVRAIGAKVSLGYGVVNEWIIEQADSDWSWYAPHEDGVPVLMRPLPKGRWLPAGLVGFRDWFGAPCGPYWDKANFTEIVQPC